MRSLLRIAPALVILSVGACGATPEPAPSSQAATEAHQATGGDWSELVPNARQPREGVVSGGQPSAEQLRQAAGAGYRTVINLRMPDESGLPDEAGIAAELGMTYVSLPIDGAAGITEENARELSSLLDSAEGPVLLHCGSGNRVGALFALEAYHVEGRSVEESIQYGLDSGLTRLEPVVRERLTGADGG